MKKTCLMLFMGILCLSGCGREISSGVYSAASVGETSFTHQGVIISARPVEICGGESLSDNGAGMLLGGVGGGLLGSLVGKGAGKIAASAGGAVLGGVAGAYSEKALKQQSGIEYVVQLTNGQLVTVVQGPAPTLCVNQKVMVLTSAQGRSRIVPDTSPAQYVQPSLAQPAVIYRK